MKIGSVVEPDAGVERGHDEVVEGQREGEHRPGRDRRRDQRQRHVPEGAPAPTRPGRGRPPPAVGPCPPPARGPRRHVRDAERDVGDRDLADRAVRPEQLEEEHQQADAHDDLGRDHRQQQQGLRRAGDRGTAGGPGPRPSSEPSTVAHDDRHQRDPERDPQRVEQLAGCSNSFGYQSSVKPCHDEVPPRVVEAEQDQHDDRREQEDVDRAARSPAASGCARLMPRHAATSRRSDRSASSVPPSVMTISRNPRADAVRPVAAAAGTAPARSSRWSSSARRRGGPGVT